MWFVAFHWSLGGSLLLITEGKWTDSIFLHSELSETRPDTTAGVDTFLTESFMGLLCQTGDPRVIE